MKGQWLRATLAAMAALAIPASWAKVLNSETLADKVMDSGTVVLAEVIDIRGQAPFNNAHRPTLHFRVIQVWRGARPGDELTVADWSDSPQFQYFADGMPPTQAQIDNSRKGWESAPVLPPARGSKVLLLLGANDSPQHFANIPFPNHVNAPDARWRWSADF
jgi:hypothetical protein